MLYNREMKIKNPMTVVILGASGDLTKRKLIPSLIDLYREGLLPEDFSVLGVARSPFNDTSFKNHLKIDETDFAFEKFLHYIQGQYDSRQTFQDIRQKVEQKPANHQTLFYLALPPKEAEMVTPHIAQVFEGLSYRIIFEKPFGVNRESALLLEESLHTLFTEDQIYRIDHYLGKETVQNILAFRFANNIFEPLWNNHYIEHIEINIAEDLGVENRGAYFDHSGIVRDIVQNHALQLLSLICMEAPESFEANAIRNEKVKLLSTIEIPTPDYLKENSIRAQYAGYTKEPGVDSNSMTETFVALQLKINNWRFGGVPIFIRAGKALAQKRTEVHVHFKQVPCNLFKATIPSFAHNTLIFRIQPHEGIHLLFQTKKPGANFHLSPQEMEFSYHENFKHKLLDAYARLLLDAMNGDPSLFIRNDEVLKSWQYVDAVIKAWRDTPSEFPIYSYSKGSIGPEEMHEFIKGKGFIWSKDFCRLKHSPQK